MSKKIKKIFNVLEYNFTTREISYYDVLPYFRNCWKDKHYNFEKDEVKDKNTLKKWIEDASRYQFWARCEYEFVMGSWPFGSRKMTDDIKDFLKKDYNLDDYSDSIKFYNIILQDMKKIDVHEQIMMNIDIIVDILFDEFKIGEKK